MTALVVNKLTENRLFVNWWGSLKSLLSSSDLVLCTHVLIVCVNIDNSKEDRFFFKLSNKKAVVKVSHPGRYRIGVIPFWLDKPMIGSLYRSEIYGDLKSKREYEFWIGLNGLKSLGSRIHLKNYEKEGLLMKNEETIHLISSNPAVFSKADFNFTELMLYKLVAGLVNKYKLLPRPYSITSCNYIDLLPFFLLALFWDGIISLINIALQPVTYLLGLIICFVFCLFEFIFYLCNRTASSQNN